jgi:hypothetical protein
MFRKTISIAIITLCLGIIGCREVNEPIFNSTYNVVTISRMPVDYWQNDEQWIMRWIHLDKNGKIEKVFLDIYGELLTVMNQHEDIVYFELDKKHYPYTSAYIKCDILCDTIKGVYGLTGPTVDAGEVDFVAVRK